MVWQRLAPRRLGALVLAHRVRGYRLCARGALTEQRRQHSHGQLRVISAETLGVLPEQAELQLAALLERAQVELAIVLALGGEPLDVGLQLGDLFHRRRRRGHAGTIAIEDHPSSPRRRFSTPASSVASVRPSMRTPGESSPPVDGKTNNA